MTSVGLYNNYNGYIILQEEDLWLGSSSPEENFHYGRNTRGRRSKTKFCLPGNFGSKRMMKEVLLPGGGLPLRVSGEASLSLFSRRLLLGSLALFATSVSSEATAALALSRFADCSLFHQMSGSNRGKWAGWKAL